MEVDFDFYEKIVILMPVWAGYPAPAFNSVIELLPKGKQIELVLKSASGVSKKESVLVWLKERGFDNVEYMDVK